MAKTLGTTLKKLKSGSEVEDLIIGSLTSIGEIGVESDELDMTHLDSPDGYKEFEGGLKDAGEVSFAGDIVDEATVEKILALAESQSKEDWVVTYPSGATWALTGYIKSFKDGEKTADGKATFTSSIRVSGKPVYTA